MRAFPHFPQTRVEYRETGDRGHVVAVVFDIEGQPFGRIFFQVAMDHDSESEANWLLPVNHCRVLHELELLAEAWRDHEEP